MQLEGSTIIWYVREYSWRFFQLVTFSTIHFSEVSLVLHRKKKYQSLAFHFLHLKSVSVCMKTLCKSSKNIVFVIFLFNMKYIFHSISYGHALRICSYPPSWFGTRKKHRIFNAFEMSLGIDEFNGNIHEYSTSK